MFAAVLSHLSTRKEESRQPGAPSKGCSSCSGQGWMCVVSPHGCLIRCHYLCFACGRVSRVSHCTLGVYQWNDIQGTKQLSWLLHSQSFPPIRLQQLPPMGTSYSEQTKILLSNMASCSFNSSVLYLLLPLLELATWANSLIGLGSHYPHLIPDSVC